MNRASILLIVFVFTGCNNVSPPNPTQPKIAIDTALDTATVPMNDLVSIMDRQEIDLLSTRADILERLARNPQPVTKKDFKIFSKFLHETEELSLRKNFRFPEIVFHSNIILGNIAFLKNDLKSAGGHLQIAASSHSLLVGWGLAYSLAKNLLDKGEKKAAFDFLKICSAGKLPPGESEKVAGWIEDIRTTGTAVFSSSPVRQPSTSSEQK